MTPDCRGTYRKQEAATDYASAAAAAADADAKYKRLTSCSPSS